MLAEGKCNSKECQNYKNCGALFYGDNTGDNFNLIFEEDDYDNIIDIRYCHEFKSHKTLRKIKNGRELKIDFYDDEVADFIPNSEYNYINTTSIEALTKFNNFVEDSTSEKDILDWLQKYSELNNSISFFDLIYLNEHSFYYLYKYLNSHTDFLNTEEGRTKVIQLCNSLLEEKKNI